MTLAILLVAELVPGIEVNNFTTALVSAFLLSLINISIKPILVILTFPITVLTLGLFYFIINAFFFSFVASIVSGLEVESLGVALIGSLVVSIVMWIAAPSGK